ncbi:hypothetical protein CPB85DRAFT_1345434 [Mucidula mucida]|nr:hypothetical protein CPB85DRAFT_1345434 [Mucidula mucida]
MPAGSTFVNWTAFKPKGAPFSTPFESLSPISLLQAPKYVVIEVVPHGVSRNASCKGCGKEMDTFSYRFKIGKSKRAPSWHPSCYEPMLNLPTNFLNNSVEFNLFGLDKEAYECLTRWAQDAFNVTLPPELFSGEASSSHVESDLGAGGVATNKRKRSEEDDEEDEDVSAVIQYGCVVTIGPAQKRVHFAPEPLPTVTEPLDIHPPRYPATISAILNALEKKKRHLVGLAAMQMSLRF